MATQLFSNNFHRKRPNMDITLSYDVSRPGGEQSKGLKYTFYGSLYCKSGEFYYASNAVGIRISVDGVTKTFYLRGKGGGSTGEGSSLAGPWTQTECIPSDESYSQTADYPTSYSFTTENIGSTAGITVYVWCHQGTYAEPRGDFNCTATGGPYDYTYTGTINVPGYNPYTAPPNYYINPSPSYGKLGATDAFSYDYKFGGGSGIIDWVDLRIYRDTTWEYGKLEGEKEANLATYQLYSTTIYSNHGETEASGNGKFTLGTDKFSDGSKYRVAIAGSDSNHRWISGDDKPIYTYRKPSVSGVKILKSDGSSTITKFSPQNNVKIAWTTNSRTWTGAEAEFTTSLGHSNSTVAADSNAPGNPSSNGSTFSQEVSQTLTTGIIDTLYSNAERSNGTLSTTISVIRSSSTAGYAISSSANIEIQYQPTLAPTNGTVTNSSGTSISGNTIFLQDTSNIYLSWKYSPSTLAAGVVDGYIIRIYADSAHTDKVGDDITVTVSRNAESGSKTINAKTQLRRGVMNYATITPFYTKPNSQGIIEGTKHLNLTLVKPMNRLNTPTIAYPINNATWHNKNFRILFELPTDDDKAELGLSDTEYKYKSIQLKVIPDIGNAIVYNSVNNPDIFSSSTLTYRKKICINPSIISSFPDASTYRLSIRVEKNYYTTDTTYSFSNWSSEVVLNKQRISELSTSVGTQVSISHYKYIRDASYRLYSAYPIKTALPSNNVSKSAGDIIYRINFKAISDTILNIQSDVNSYCSYDRSSVKFNQTIPSLSVKEETITADKENTSVDGHNYMNLLVEYMNLLK